MSGDRISLRTIKLQNGGTVGLGALPDEGWAVLLVNGEGEETKLAMSDQAIAALVHLYRNRGRQMMERWQLVLPADPEPSPAQSQERRAGE